MKENARIKQVSVSIDYETSGWVETRRGSLDIQDIGNDTMEEKAGELYYIKESRFFIPSFKSITTSASVEGTKWDETNNNRGYYFFKKIFSIKRMSW